MRNRRQFETPMETLDRLSMPITECGCHAWLGKIGTGGYAYMSYYTTPGKRVHRKAATVAWELANARERPEGLEIDHIAQCRMPWCVNPDHLRLATRSENSLNRAPYRYIENCVHCGEPKKFYADWVKPEWRCPNYNEHVRSGNTKLPTSNSLKRRGKNGPKPQL